jgi:hypothetical protein
LVVIQNVYVLLVRLRVIWPTISFFITELAIRRRKKKKKKKY